MTGINYVTNDKGEKTALLIDLNELKRSGKAGGDVSEFLDDLEDILAIELSKGEEYVDWEDVKQDLRNAGKLD